MRDEWYDAGYVTTWTSKRETEMFTKSEKIDAELEHIGMHDFRQELMSSGWYNEPDDNVIYVNLVDKFNMALVFNAVNTMIEKQKDHPSGQWFWGQDSTKAEFAYLEGMFFLAESEDAVVQFIRDIHKRYKL